jgi:phosphate transport system substrate-binding protein
VTPRTFVAVAASMTVIAVGLIASPSASATATDGAITGSGSAWAAKAVHAWVDGTKPLDYPVTYTSSGSTQGRQDFASAATDFAVTDVPYQGVDPVTNAPDTSNGRAYGDVPLVAGGTAFPYHLDVGGTPVRNLRLSQQTIEKIFTNQITNWDDPEITTDNNGVSFPSLPIIPVVHREESGVSLEFTTFLATEFSTDWGTFSGGDAVTPYFPREGNAVAEDGSQAVLSAVTAAAANGAIGMDEYSFALAADTPVAEVENAAGYFAAPSADDVAIALESATIDTNSSDAGYMRPDLKGVFESTDPRAYPLSTYSSMLIPVSATDAAMTTAKRQTIADFTDYSICDGQKGAGAIGDAPLPLNLVKAAFTQVDRLGAADSKVDLSKDTISSCDNPTFDPKTPDSGLLDSTAPQPKACDQVAHGPCGAPAVTRTPSLVSLAAAPTSVVFGQKLNLHGTLTDGKGKALAGSVDLQRRTGSKVAWTTIRVLTTSSKGVVHAGVLPTINADFRFRHAMDHVSSASVSAIRHVTVLALVKARFTAKSVVVGHTAVVVGRVEPDPSYLVQLQRLRGHVWQTVDAVQRSSPSFRLHAEPGQVGEAEFRVRVKATAFNGTGSTHDLKIRVRAA